MPAVMPWSDSRDRRRFAAVPQAVNRSVGLMRSLLAFGVLSGVACLPGCGEPPPIDTDTPAGTARLRIGRLRLHLPVVAINRVDRAYAPSSFWRLPSSC